MRSMKSYGLFFLVLLAAVVCKAPAAMVRSSGLAQSQKEREFENKIPKHLPLQVRIQPDTEKAAKDPDNNRWHHDVAFEVKNTGDKPIYFLSLFLEMPEIKPNGDVLAWPLSYGRSSMVGNGQGFAQPEEVPIKPNETIVLTLSKAQADGWDQAREIDNLPQPTKLEIIFQELNFGDGTGFIGGTGTPWPRPKR